MMMDVNDEYSKLCEAPGVPIPMLGEVVDNDFGPYRVADDFVCELRFAAPVPAKPVTADYMLYAKPLVSLRVAEAIASMNPGGVQLVPCHIDNRKGVVYKKFYVWHVYSYMQNVVDIHRSNGNYEPELDLLFDVHSLVLNDDVVKRIPLNERLLMCPRQCPAHVLFHQSVVDAVMALDPKPVLRFVPLREWSDDMAFRG